MYVYIYIYIICKSYQLGRPVLKQTSAPKNHILARRHRAFRKEGRTGLLLRSLFSPPPYKLGGLKEKATSILGVDEGHS